MQPVLMLAAPRVCRQLMVTVRTPGVVAVQLCFFFCFILPWTVDKIDNMSKFELTPEMQEELKELMEKVRRRVASIQRS